MILCPAGGEAAMLVDGDEAVWSEAVCDAARSVISYPSLDQDKDIHSSGIGCPG